MSRAERETENLSPLETALAHLVPNAGGLNRDDILYRAGQASAKGQAATRGTRRPWAWPVAFGTMTAAATTMLVMLLVQQRPQMVTIENSHPVEDVKSADTDQRVVPQQAIDDDTNSGQIEESIQPALSSAVAWRLRNALRTHHDEAVYLQLRDRVLAFGLDWPAPPARGDDSARQADSDASYQQLRRIWMDS